MSEPEVIIVPHPGRKYTQFIALQPLLTHLSEIRAEDPDSHAGEALGALLRFHGRRDGWD